MKYMIEALSCFSDGRLRRQPGKYRVPEDLTPGVAEKQLSSGNARKVMPKVAPENKIVSPPEPGEDPSSALGLQSHASGQGQPLLSLGAGRRSRRSKSNTREARDE